MIDILFPNLHNLEQLEIELELLTTVYDQMMAKNKNKTKKNAPNSSSTFNQLPPYPFSPAFISSQAPCSQKRSKRAKRSNPQQAQQQICQVNFVDDLGSSSSEKSTSDIVSEFQTLTFQSNNKQAVIILPSKNSLLYISGICQVTLLRGNANINGYQLKKGVALKVQANVWQPAARMSTTSKESGENASRNVSLRAILTKFNIWSELAIAKAKDEHPISSNDNVILIKGYEFEDLEWLEAAEDYSKYSQDIINTSLITDTWSFSSGVISRLSCFSTIEPMTLHSSWITSSDSMIQHISRGMNTKTLFCGAKGVGKSSCMRYNINRILNKSKAVCVIDCDIGQPEFSVPGILSMHIIRDPILTPTHMNMHHTPELSFFIGDITSKTDPSLTLSCIHALFKRYQTLSTEFERYGDTEAAIATFNQGSSSSHNTHKSSNPFNLLDTLDEVEDIKGPLPLLINCDGNIRYTGSEILEEIIKITQPSHIFHIVTPKDKDLLSQLQTLQRPGPKPVVCSLDPGRETPSRIVPGDLRLLRLVSYFLRNEISLRAQVNPNAYCKTRPLRTVEVQAEQEATGVMDGTNEEDNNDEFSEEDLLENIILDDQSLEEVDLAEFTPLAADVPVVGLEEPQGGGGRDVQVRLRSRGAGNDRSAVIRIRQAAIVDYAGFIAFALISSSSSSSSQQYAAPFDTLAFRCMEACVSVVPRLVLAAFNASLVGIARLRHEAEEGEEDGAGLSNSREFRAGDSGVRFSLDCIDGSGTGTGTCLPDCTRLECIGLGIVRAVDVRSSCVYITTPADIVSAFNGDRDKVFLLKGSLQLPLCFSYSPSLPTFPYMSGEVFGEGTASMKSRPNLKRRSQHPQR